MNVSKAKSLLASKTFWFNVLAAATAFGMSAAGVNVDTTIQAVVIAGGNTVLRLLTKQPIS